METRVRLLQAPLLLALLLPGAGGAQAQQTPQAGRSVPLTRSSRSSSLDDELKTAIAAAPAPSVWPNNSYVRLLDLGDVTVAKDGTTTGYYRETYKLFDKKARDLAEVSIPYNASYQSVHILFARTIKKDGSVVDVKPEDIRESNPYSEYLMYDDAKAVGFSMPAIEDDCVIDYRYEIVTRPLLMHGQFWTYWGFSGPEPVTISKYVLHAPTDQKLKFKVYNDDRLQRTETKSPDGSTTTYTWEEKNIQPIEVEPFMPPIENVRVWMEVSSLDSWQDIAKWFSGLQKPQAVASPALQQTVLDITKNAKTDDEKARAIYEWVSNRTRYVGLEFGLSAYKPHAASEVYSKLYGDCKDKANLLITMLALAGIKAHPVLLHAEERRDVAGGLPTLTAFDHCIALADVGKREVWLDATAETCAYGDIPGGDRGVQALVVRDGAADFETIPRYTADENGVVAETHVGLHPDGGADVRAEFKMYGESGQAMRAMVSELSPDKRKELITRIAGAYSAGAVVKDFTLPDGSDKDGPFVMKLTATAPNFAKRVGKMLLVPLSGTKIGEHGGNPYTRDHRVWPIVEEDTSRTSSTTYVELPVGFTVEDSPTDVNLASKLQSFKRAIAPSSDGKQIVVTEIIEDRSGTVPSADYTNVKSYYDSVLKAADDQVILKSKG